MKTLSFFKYLVFFLIFYNCQEPKDSKENLVQNYSKLRLDTARFLAHAGGGIDGHKYTNTLEALDLNYQKGFRFFELDIISTIDSQLVACHDWGKWKEQTAHTGKVPVSESVFLEKKILSKYSTLSLENINSWFQNHSDAFLVTDKINEPNLIVNQFIDKNRLMMELFTLEAILEAQKLGLKMILASERVLDSFGNKRMEKLLENNIGYVTFSISYMENNRSFMKELKQHDIRAIVYNLTEEKDEKYLIQNEMGYIYGFYADTWEF